MRQLTFTLFANEKARKGDARTASWADWTSTLTTHEVRPSDPADLAALNAAKSGPALILGELNGHRAAKNVTALHAVAADIDGTDAAQLAAALERISELTFVCYTTHKSGADVVNGRPRVRIVFPLETTADPSQAKVMHAGLDALLGGGIVDPATKDAGRLHYLPSTFELGQEWSVVNEGRWLAPSDLATAAPAPAAPGGEPDLIDPGDMESEDALYRIRGWLARVLVAAPFKPIAVAVLAGEPFAEPGDSHRALRDMTWQLAKKFPKAPNPAICQLFYASVQAMQAAGSSITLDEVVTAFEGAVIKREEHLEEQRASAQAGPEGSYTEEEIARIAAHNGWQPEDLAQRWIIQKGPAVWYLTASGDYAGPFGKDEWIAAASQFLGRAPARLIEVTERGGTRRRAFADVVCESGSIASVLVADLTTQRTRYNGSTQTLYEAVRPLRTDLTPTFDPEIDRWLQLLGGERYEWLVDWLSCVPDLSKLLCAVYLKGPPRCGKTLLAHGLARLWVDDAEGPGDLEKVMGSFNDEIMRCPLLLADEEIPRVGRQTVTTTLRSMLSVFSRSINRKFMPPMSLHGAVRLVLAANHEYLLTSEGVVTPDDLSAVAERFLYIDVPPTAVAALDQIPSDIRNEWRRRGIAQHALWLASNHTVQHPGRRFAVEGDISSMHRLLLTGSKMNSLVCEWLVKYLMNPGPGEARAEGLIRRDTGELLVNSQAISDGWEVYLRNSKTEPEARLISTSLRAISERRVRESHKGRQHRYHVIDIGVLCDWADRHNQGSSEEIRRSMTEGDKRPTAPHLAH